MVEREDIVDLAERIAREFQPERIILFGSYAYGTPTGDSDVDLLVVLPFAGHPARKAAEIRSTVRARFPLDLMARTPEELQKRLEWSDYFIREIVEKGSILYEATHR